MADQTPFVGYYSENGISPVSQDISDLKKHFGRRSRLYERLGIAPALVRGRDVIEFGPGSGHNSLYTLSLGPGRYHLVDGNPVGLKDCQKLLEADDGRTTRLEMTLATIDEFAQKHEKDSDCVFDLVLCEGLLSFQLDPPRTAGQVSSFTRTGGVLVATCSDSVSMLSDCVRRLLGQALDDHAGTLEERAEALVPFFAGHFKMLPGMSRPVRDWILDFVLQPIYGPNLSFIDLIEALGRGFNLLGASPSFLVDWRWYKDMDGQDSVLRAMAKDQYLAQVHNFLDYSVIWPSREPGDNLELIRLTDGFFQLCLDFQHEPDPDLLNSAGNILRLVADNLSSLGAAAAPTATGYRDAAAALERAAEGDKRPDCGSFTSIFGRGQQYFSFVRSAGNHKLRSTE